MLIQSNETTFDVTINAINGGQVIDVIGRNLTESKAEQRLMTGRMRIDRDNYFVAVVPHDPLRK
jgi:hypothetical protein